jgi:type III secretory pathway component EscS
VAELIAVRLLCASVVSLISVIALQSIAPLGEEGKSFGVGLVVVLLMIGLAASFWVG